MLRTANKVTTYNNNNKQLQQLLINTFIRTNIDNNISNHNYNKSHNNISVHNQSCRNYAAVAKPVPHNNNNSKSSIRRRAEIIEKLRILGGIFGSDDSGVGDDRSSAREEKTGDFDSKIDDIASNEVKESEDEPLRKNMKPSDLVRELDKHIVGQLDAKKQVAVALRNRYRRHLLSKDLRDEVMPKNILMIGPTGSGKTEIARRLAKITDSPFIKVEATKFTEVGFYGKDVDTIIKDLLRITVSSMKAKKRIQYREKIDKQVEDTILDALVGSSESDSSREAFRTQLKSGLLEPQTIEIEVPSPLDRDSQQIVHLISGTFGSKVHPKGIKKRVTIAEARPILTESLMQKAMSNIDVSKAAIRAVEQDGIVFLDEIDKICSGGGDGKSFRSSADASAEGVQRDLLPLVEGTAITTNLGTVHTDHILFVCSGAFHAVKPSDLLPELQGRLPIRVELKALDENDLYRILTQPVNNLIKQQVELLKTDNVLLNFTDEAIREIARVAHEVNRTVENIGARRLNTIIQRICDEISYTAADCDPGTTVTIDKTYVIEKVKPLMQSTDLSRFVL